MSRKKSKSLSISMKVVKKGDIVNLAEIFSREAKKSEEAGNNYILRYEVEDHDGVITTDKDPAIFTSKDPLDFVKSKSITMTYYDLDEKLDIKLTLTQGGRDNNNSGLQISGKNEWFVVIHDDFKKIIGAIQPQTCFFLRHKKLSVSLLSLGCKITSDVVLLFITQFLDKEGIKVEINSYMTDNSDLLITGILSLMEDHVWLSLALLFLFGWLMFLPLSKLILDRMLRLWSNIEFDFGPEHQKLEKSKRKRMFAFLTILIVPVAIAVLSMLV